MKILSISLGLVLLCSPAFAAHVYFDDGRVCKGCSVQQTGDTINKVTDKKGNNWRITEGQRIWVDKHPYGRMYAQGLALSAQQYSQQVQYQNMIEQQRRPVNVSCSSYGSGYSISTNCSSY